MQFLLILYIFSVFNSSKQKSNGFHKNKKLLCRDYEPCTTAFLSFLFLWFYQNGFRIFTIIFLSLYFLICSYPHPHLFPSRLIPYLHFPFIMRQTVWYKLYFLILSLLLFNEKLNISSIHIFHSHIQITNPGWSQFFLYCNPWSL